MKAITHCGYAVALALIALGCGSGEDSSQHGKATPAASPPPSYAAPAPKADANADRAYARFFIARNGSLQLNGKPSSLQQFGEALDLLARNNGVVLYAIEPPDPANPNPDASKAANVIIERRMTTRLCLKPDCSDLIDPDGKLRPWDQDKGTS